MPPSSIRTKSASLLDVVVVGVSELPVVRTVPVAFGKVTVRSAVGSVTVRVVSYASAVEPSNTTFPVIYDVPVVVVHCLLFQIFLSHHDKAKLHHQ